MMNEILDYEPEEPKIEEELPVRNLAWAMEYLPLGGFVFGAISMRSGASYAVNLYLASTLCLLVVYGFFSWYLFQRAPRTAKTIGLSQLTGLSFCVLILGILFKLESWPNAYELLCTAWASTGIFTLISGVSYGKSETKLDKEFYFKIFTRTGMMTLLLTYWWWKTGF